MKQHLKITHTETTRTVSEETGELLNEETKQNEIIAGTKEDFLLIYSGMIGVMKLFTQAQVRVFAYLLRYADGTRFAVTKALREQMQNEIKINERSIYNTLIQLEDKGLIFKANNLYQVNPRYAFKGSSLNRNGALKAIIKLGCKDC